MFAGGVVKNDKQTSIAAGPAPTCKCGKPMVWEVFYVDDPAPSPGVTVTYGWDCTERHSWDFWMHGIRKTNTP